MIVDSVEDNLLQFQLFYSQGRQGNANSRVPSVETEFLKQMYAKTQLDFSLLSDIESNLFDLVIITGNPGDGKTAFLKRLEAGGTNCKEHPNGKEFQKKTHKFEVNYDGSQDFGEKNNDEILREFFYPVELIIRGVRDSDRTRVIAINEGRLLRFLQTRDFESLYEEVRNQIKHGKINLKTRVMVIDLNLRSVVASRKHSGSIFQDILRNMVDPKWWKKCEECTGKKHCPVYINILNLQRNDIADRLRELFRMVILWGQEHITIRDLLSALSFIIFGEANCDEIMKESQDLKWLLEKLYFNAIHHGSSKDRVLSILKEFRFDLVPVPPLIENDVYFNDIKVVLENHGQYYENIALQTLTNAISIFGVDISIGDDDRKKYYHSIVKNLLFFEGSNDVFEAISPIRFYSDFTSIFGKTSSVKRQVNFNLKRQIIRALNRSRGIDEENKLVVEHSRGQSKLVAYSEIGHRHFGIQKDAHAHEYCEVEPDHLNFFYKDGKSIITLEVDLAMYELVRAIGAGYIPTSDELEGRFFNLGIFMEQLEELPQTSIIIMDRRNKVFAEVSESADAIEVI